MVIYLLEFCGIIGDVQERRLSDEFDPRTAIFVFNKWDLVENKEKQKVLDLRDMKSSSEIHQRIK